MEKIFAALKIVGLFVILVTAFCSCTTTGIQKSAAEKEREAWYSNYVDNIDRTWSTHL
jgi:hypothetical protein